jgi:hypothetical protein
MKGRPDSSGMEDPSPGLTITYEIVAQGMLADCGSHVKAPPPIMDSKHYFSRPKKSKPKIAQAEALEVTSGDDTHDSVSYTAWLQSKLKTLLGGGEGAEAKAAPEALAGVPSANAESFSQKEVKQTEAKGVDQPKSNSQPEPSPKVKSRPRKSAKSRKGRMNEQDNTQSPATPGETGGEAQGQAGKPLGLILREQENQLRSFLSGSSAGVQALKDLVSECRKNASREIKQSRLGNKQEKTALNYLDAVYREVLLEKIRMILIRYLESGTDYNLVSGRLWATRNQVTDYMSFLFSGLEELEAAHRETLKHQSFKTSLTNMRTQLAIAAAAFND